MNASTELGLKIELGRKTLAETEKRQSVALEESQGQIEADQDKVEIQINGNVKPNTGSRNRRRKSVTNPGSKSRVSLADMENYKERIDHCLANNIEMDLVRLMYILYPICTSQN